MVEYVPLVALQLDHVVLWGERGAADYTVGFLVRFNHGAGYGREVAHREV